MNDAGQIAPNRLLRLLRLQGADNWPYLRWTVLAAFCLAVAATALWVEPAAAQAPITTHNPCFASENLTQQTGTALRGIASQPVISRDGTRLAFWSTNDITPSPDPSRGNADGNIEIFVMDLTGERGATQLTHSTGSILGGFNLEPSINAAGTHIAFYSDRDLVGRNADGNFEIFLARRTNSGWEITQVTDTQGSANLFPSINAANDGVVRIAFVSDDKDLGGVDANPFRNFEIFLATIRNGSVQIRQITNSPAGTTNDQPAINAAGDRIVYTAGMGQAWQIYVWDENRGAATQLTSSGSNTQPAINADGTHITYIGTNNQGRTRVILHTLSADGTEGRSEPLVGPSANATYRNPNLSDDGGRVVYVEDAGSGSNRRVSVVLYDVGSRLPVVISQLGDGIGEQPTISGNGTRITYVGTPSVGGSTDGASSDIYAHECPRADLSLEFVQQPPATVLAGTNLTVRLRVTNHGPSVARGAAIEVNLTDVAPLPANVTRVLPAQCRSAPNGNALCDLGDLNVGQSVTRDFVFELPSNAGLADIEYAYAVTANAVDQNEADNKTGIRRTRVVEEAALKITMAANPPSIVAGLATDVLTYDLMVSNGGPSQARSTVLTDTLPTGAKLLTATLVSGGGSGVTCPVTANDARVTCRLGNLLAGASAHVRVQVNALPSAPETFVNVAEVRSLTDELDTSDNIVSATTAVSRSADMQISISGWPTDTVHAGAELTYTVVVTNAGLAETEGVKVINLLPEHVTFVRDATSAGGTCKGDVPGGTVTCTVTGTMEPGETRTLRYVTLVSPTAPEGAFENTARVTSQRADPNPDNNVSNPAQNNTVRWLADLLVEKSVNKPKPNVGEWITYTVTVSNSGPSQAYGVVITDLLPIGMEHVSHTVSTGTYSETTGVWNVGEIPLREERLLHIIAEPQVSIGGVLVTNTAAVFSSASIDPVDGLSSQAAVGITPQLADLAVSKTAPAVLAAGRNITYTITVTNAGPTAAKDVVVTDTLPAGVGLVSRPTGCTEAAGQVICEAGEIQPNKTVTYSVVVTRSVTGQITNTVSVGSSTPDNDPDNNSKIVPSTILPDVPAFLTFTQQPPAAATAGEGFSLEVALHDRFGNPVNVGDGSGDTIELTVYRDASCTEQIDDVPFSGNQVSAQDGIAFFDSLEYTRAETIYLLAKDVTPGRNVDPACSNAVVVGAAQTAQIVFISASMTVTAGQVSDVITVQRQDEFGNPNSSDLDLTLNLTTTAASGAFLTDTSPLPITQVTITEGSSIASFIYTDTVQGVYTLTVGNDDMALIDAVQTITVTADTAKQLVILAPPPPITAGVPSDVITVQRQDQFGNANFTDEPVTLDLVSSSGTYTFYNSADEPVDSLKIDTGSASADFRYVDTLAATHTLTVSDQDGPLTSAQVSVKVVPGPSYRLRLTTEPYTITAGTSTGVIRVVRQDQFGNLNDSDPDLTVALTTDSTGDAARFTATPGAGTSITSVVIAKDSSAADFAYHDELAGTHVLTVTDVPGELLPDAQTVRVEPGAATGLAVLTAGQVVTAGMASDVITVVRQDQFGNPDPNAGTTVVSLHSSSNTGVFLEATEDEGIDQVIITETEASFRYSDTVAGSLVLTLEPDGLPVVTHAITITADTATQLIFTAAPPTSTAGVLAGPFTLQRLDQYGNANSTDPALAVHLDGHSEGAKFFAGPPPMVMAGDAIEIVNGSATGDFYYYDTLAGSHVITASAAIGSIAPVTTVIEVAPGAPAQLAFLGDQQTITAGVTSEVFVVELQDMFENAVTPTTLITATLSSMPDGPKEFLDAPGGSPKEVLTFDGNSQDTFYYTAQRAGLHALVAEATKLPSIANGTQNVWVVAAETDHILFVTEPHQFEAGQMSPLITVERRDQFDNTNSSDPTLTLNLTTTAVASGAFLTDTSPLPITQVTIEQGNHRASFYYSDTVRATPMITVSDEDGVLASISQTHTVVGGPAARLVLDGPATTSAGTSVAITIAALDALGNQADSVDGQYDVTFGGVAPAPNGQRSTVTNVGGAPIDFGLPVDLLFVEGVATASGGQNMLTIYKAGSQVITATMDGPDVEAVGADALTIEVDPAAQAVVRAETASTDGKVVGSRTLTAGETVDIYAVSRDMYLNETGTVAAEWTLASTGAVQPGDLAPTTGVSTTFSARGVGTAVITPTFGSLTSIGTGVLTVVAGEAATVRVETAGDGSGELVSSQILTPGQSITVYAVARDAYGNFITSPAAKWGIDEATGGVNINNLSAIEGTSITLTASKVGSGRIVAAFDDLEPIASGVITVTAGPPVRLALATEDDTTIDAGDSLAVKVTAYDAADNVATSYDGERTLIFSGAAPSLRPVITPTVTNRTGEAIDFGQPVTLYFDKGVAAPTDGPDTQRITIYRAGSHTISATDGTLMTDPAGTLTVTVEGLGVERLALETPTTDYTAGVAVPLTIKAEDAYGNIDASYDSSKNLRFESNPSATAPDGTQSFVQSGQGQGTGQPKPLGQGTQIVFVDGIAQASATSNGALTLYRSGEFAISVEQNSGHFPSGPLGTITVTVAPSPDQVPVLSLNSPQVNGELFTGPDNRIEIHDVYSNMVTDFNAALYPVTLTVEAPLDGVISLASSGNDNVLDADEFSNGVAQLGDLGLRYSGVAGTGNFVASMANPAGGTSSHAVAVTVNPAAPTLLQIQGAVEANPPTSEITVTAGTAISLTLRAYDFTGNLTTGYSATPEVFFSGAPALDGTTPPDPSVSDVTGATVRFGEGTDLQFINGVAQVTNDGENGTLRIYQTGTYMISAHSGEMDTPSGNQLVVHVVPGPVASYEVNFTSPQPLGQPFGGTNTVRALDAYGNLITDYDGGAEPVRIVPLSPLTGTVSGLTGDDSDIIDAGAWSGGQATVNGLIYDNDTDTPETGAFRAERVGDSPQPFGDSQPIEFVMIPPP